MHLAAENGDPEMINLLLEAGASVNCVDKYSATPLHYAAFDAYPDNVKALILNGGDKNALDDFHQSPLDLALKNGKFKNAELLSMGNPVRYGDLTLFPDRPSINECELETYFHQVQQNFADIGNAEMIIESLLKTNGLSRVQYNDGENQEIKIYVENFVECIAKRIGELDYRFQGTVITSGSVYEGVKIGYPDEFDYMINLEKFSDNVADFRQIPKTKGFVKLSAKSDGFDEFIDENMYLNSVKIYNSFRRLFYIASVDTLKIFTRLQGGYTLFFKYKDVFSEIPLRQSQLAQFNKSWRGGNFKTLEISIDINPVIYVEQMIWPDSVIKSSSVIGDLQNKGLYVIPKAPKDTLNLMLSKKDFLDKEVWRISFSHIENEIFNAVSQSLRDAFCIIKLLKKEPF